MSAATQVLVVEDDATLREALCSTIECGGYRALAAEDGRAALDQLDGSSVDMVISDWQMDGMDGRRLLREVRHRNPQMPFVMMTAHDSVSDAVAAMRDGATDYLLKPFEAQVLLDLMARMEPPAADDSVMVSRDAATRNLCNLAQRVAKTDATVLISGESGCGKEMLARFIHDHSDRRARQFSAINCAAIPENMLESMLFGYEKGAYTGAHQSRAGKFEQANGGTLLLDEISEMELALQAKLLRVLQEKEVERLGGSKVIPLDVRVLATTNRELSLEVQEGRFREDLFYRLNVVPLHIPPLRERRGDILPLAERFLLRYQQSPGVQFSAAAREFLLEQPWNGNARELENCVQRAAILTASDTISEADLLLLCGSQGTGFLTASGSGSVSSTAQSDNSGVPTAQPAPSETAASSSPALEGDLKQREQELIISALRRSGGNRKAAAEQLGISPRTLRYKLARMRDEGTELPGKSGGSSYE